MLMYSLGYTVYDFHREQHELHGQNETDFFSITLAIMPYCRIGSITTHQLQQPHI